MELQADAYFLDKDPPAIVYVSSKETKDLGWGFVQFPMLGHLEDGSLLLSFQEGEDSSDEYGKDNYKYYVSYSNGKDWKEISKDERSRRNAYPGLQVDDGAVISVHTEQPFKKEDLGLPATPYTWIPYDYTYSEPVEAYQFDDLPAKARTIAIRRTPKVGESVIEHAPMTLFGDLRFLLGKLVPIIYFGQIKRLPDNSIAGVFYTSFATKDNVVDPKSGILLVQSSDEGKSWNQIDRLSYTPDTVYDPKGYMRGGFTEPSFEILNDGSLILALRTADATPEPFPGFTECGPLYTVKRTTQGEWSTPTPVSPYGVMPQLLKLKNGLLVLSYGRPGIQVRVSPDEGATWTAPFDILEAIYKNPRTETCGYTSILEDINDPNAFFIAYSNFQFVDSDRKPHKAIIVQHCKVKGPVKLSAITEEEAAEFNKTIEQNFVAFPDKVALRIHLKDNVLSGTTEGFYQNGVPSFITPYRNGEVNGMKKFFAPEGYMIKSIPYINGKVEGIVRTYDQRGNILREQYFIDNDSLPLKEYLNLKKYFEK